MMSPEEARYVVEMQEGVTTVETELAYEMQETALRLRGCKKGKVSVETGGDLSQCRGSSNLVKFFWTCR
jgi:hypothetical protein